MAKFILVYRGRPADLAPEERGKHMGRFKEWMGSIGKALVSPANPVGPSKIVGSDGVTDGAGPHVFNGYTVFEAESMDAALEIAKRCPYLDMGTLEVAKLMHMGPKPS